MSKPKLLDNPIDTHFRELSARWKAETGVLSSLNERCKHPAYQEIVAMGESVVELILSELEREPDWWFAALKAITNTDPVPAESRGRLIEMTKAWLNWARIHGYHW